MAQHGFGYELAFAVIVDVDVQAVHDVEMGVREELAHGGIAHLRGHFARGKTAEVGRGRQPCHFVHGGCQAHRPRRRRIGQCWFCIACRCGATGFCSYCRNGRGRCWFCALGQIGLSGTLPGGTRLSFTRRPARQKRGALSHHNGLHREPVWAPLGFPCRQWHGHHPKCSRALAAPRKTRPAPCALNLAESVGW